MYCQHCGTQLSDNANFCQSCGTRVDSNRYTIPSTEAHFNSNTYKGHGTHKKSGTLVVILCMFAAVIGICLIGTLGKTSSSDTAANAEPTTEASESTTHTTSAAEPSCSPYLEDNIVDEPSEVGTKENPYTDGMYKVGTDLPAGEYLFMADNNTSGYVCVSSDSNQDDILENENFECSFFVSVRNGQYLQAKRCIFVIASDYFLTINEDGSFGEGMYRVGIDIPAGEYKLSSSSSYSSSYYCIYDNSEVPFHIQNNDNFDGSSYVTVEDGEYLLIKGCSAVPA